MANERNLPELTREQAIILTAVTGMTCIRGTDFKKGVEEKLGREVHVAEFNNEHFQQELKNLFWDDFLKIVHKDSGLILPND